MSKNFCVDIETGNAFVYEITLESRYMQGRFGSIPRIDIEKPPIQFIHHNMKIVNPKKLVKRLRELADKLEETPHE